MQSKLYVDTTLIKIILLECSVKENKANKWTTKLWNLARRTRSSLSKSLQGPVQSALCESTEWELELGGEFGRRRRVLPPPSASWWCLFWTLFLPCCIQLQQQLAPNQAGATKYSLACLDAVEEVSEEDFCVVHHISIRKNLPQKQCCSRQVEKAL